MAYLIVFEHIDGKITKYNTASSEAEAQALIAKKKAGFYVTDPGEDLRFLVVSGETVSVDNALKDQVLTSEETAKIDARREREYEQIDGIGLEAIRKVIAAIVPTDELPNEYVDYLQKIQAIKDKYPKSHEAR